LTVAILIDCTRGQFEDGLCRRLLAGRESVSIQLEKQHTAYESGALIAINEGMILNDARRVLGSKFDDVRTRVGNMVQRPRKRGLKQRFVPHTSGAAMLDEQPIVDRQDQVFLDPDRLAHLARTWSVFR